MFFQTPTKAKTSIIKPEKAGDRPAGWSLRSPIARSPKVHSLTLHYLIYFTVYAASQERETQNPYV